MKALPLIKKGPKTLVAILNGIIRTINGLTVVAGSGGISVVVTETGWVINYTPLAAGSTTPGATPGAAPSPSGGGGGGGGGAKTPDGQPAGWYQIEVFDSNCTPFTMWVWGAFVA